MPIGADVSAQYTEEAVGGGHPTKARVIDRLALVEHHVDGKHNAAKFPIGCGGYFKYNSATECQLGKSASPGNFWGDAIPFNPASGDPYFLPLGAAKTISNAGLAATTNHFAYAWDTNDPDPALRVALELSTTAPDLTSNKLPIKTGDATRTLVGILRTGAGTPGVFVDSATQRLVASFWNRVPRSAFSSFNSGSTASGTWVNLSNLKVVGFSGDLIRHTGSGYMSSDTIGGSALLTVSADSALAGTGTANQPTSAYTAPVANYVGAFSVHFSEQLPGSGARDSFLYILRGGAGGTASFFGERHEILFLG